MIWISQCKCPSGHCLYALAWDSATHSSEEVGCLMRKGRVVLLKDGGMNPWCHICRSRDWHYEEGLTKFDSLDAAVKSLSRAMKQQLQRRPGAKVNYDHFLVK